MADQGVQRLSVVGGGVACLGPRRDGTLAQGERRVRHHQVSLELKLRAQTITGGAGAEGVVEREQARLDFLDGETGNRAGEFLGEDHLARIAVVILLVGEFGDGDAVGKAQGSLHRVRQAACDVRAHDEAVHHHFDVMFLLLVEGGHAVEFIEFTIHLHALEAALEEVGELLAVFALAAADHRGQQVKAGAFLQGEDTVHHLADGLAFNGQAGGGGIGDADAREQQAHIVVDLGDRAHRRARVARGGLLLDGDRRGQALDVIDVRLFHHLQELPRIGREAFHVAALAFRVDRVEGKRRLAGAGEPRDHHQLVARQLDIHAFEIVFAGAFDGDVSKSGHE